MFKFHNAIPLLLVGAVALGTSNCSDSASTIFVRQVQVAVQDNDCEVEADPSALFLPQGTLDISYGNPGYQANVLVGNQLVPRADNDRLRTETSRVQLYEAEVEIFDFSGASLGAYSIPISGFVDPTNNTQAGYGLTRFNLIDPSVIPAIDLSAGSQTVVSRLKIYGVTLGGTEVETEYWDYPIVVCNGCLASECIEPNTCEDELLQECNFGQDDRPDCRSVGLSSCN